MVETQRSQKQQRSDDNATTTLQRLQPTTSPSSAHQPDNWWSSQRILSAQLLVNFIFLAAHRRLLPTITHSTYTRTGLLLPATSAYLRRSTFITTHPSQVHRRSINIARRQPIRTSTSHGIATYPCQPATTPTSWPSSWLGAIDARPLSHPFQWRWHFWHS